MTVDNTNNSGRCPVLSTHHQATGDNANAHWWPEAVNLGPLKQFRNTPDHAAYAKAFAELDFAALKADLAEVMTDSQDWWPADYGHYGPFFIRMAWHSAGTYRIHDGRGGGSTGSQRFAPLNSWPDNVNLDKARRLLWPVKQKYGAAISWADLMILAGNVALETMGCETFGFGGGRTDVDEPEQDINWGPEATWLGDERHSDGELANPLGAVQMGLIYVNPEGPGGNPDPLASALDIRETFARMAMNDEETVALVAGGHTFGKTHGAADADVYVGPEPEGASLAEQGFGWKNSFGEGKGSDTISSGLEGAWTVDPVQWSNNFFDNLFGYEWELTTSPAGAQQWRPVDRAADDTVPDAHDPNRRHCPIMLTSDLALRFDPIYEPISRHFHENPDAFADAFARAWFKLTHRDMGPVARYLGPEVPQETLIWQDPVPALEGEPLSDADIAALKTKLAESGLSVADLVTTAWASASTFRVSDMRGGANGARIRLEPQKSWEVNNPTELGRVLDVLAGIQTESGTGVSMADLIVLGGVVGIEQALAGSAHAVDVPFLPGRTDASAEQTDAEAFEVLEPAADGFRNYSRSGDKYRPEYRLVDRAALLGLTPREMTALIGGMRALGANYDGSNVGVLTERPGTLSNDFFVNLLDMATEWTAGSTEGRFNGVDRASGASRWEASEVDLLLGSNSELRAVSEIYGSSDGEALLVSDFVDAWTKVMNADRFDVS